MDKAKVKNKIVAIAREIGAQYRVRVMDYHADNDKGFLTLKYLGSKFDIDLNFTGYGLGQSYLSVGTESHANPGSRLTIWYFIGRLEEIERLDALQEKAAMKAVTNKGGVKNKSINAIWRLFKNSLKGLYIFLFTKKNN